jgi:hypothetical protein
MLESIFDCIDTRADEITVALARATEPNTDLAYHLSRLRFLPEEFERQFRERFAPSAYLDAVVYILRNTAASVETAVRNQIAGNCSRSHGECPLGPHRESIANEI